MAKENSAGRIIKFRAWDGKEMFYQDENTASEMFGLAFFAQKVGAVRGMTPPVMQFTGLTDKDGKEIYEGDLLSFNSRPPSGAVTFKDGTYWTGDSVIGRAAGMAEIIGNIYENPELLK